MARLVVVAGLIGVAVLGVVAQGYAQGDGDLAAVVADLEARITAIEERLATRPVATADATGLRIEGTGDAVSEPFALTKGTVLFTIATVDDGGYATVDLLAAPGSDRTDYRNLDIGQAEHLGTVAVPIFAPGEYVVAVKARGAWSVVIEQ